MGEIDGRTVAGLKAHVARAFPAGTYVSVDVWNSDAG